eukprot:SAG31_NODE_1_length_62978_cov_30.836130_30_plen_1491_part_01
MSSRCGAGEIELMVPTDIADRQCGIDPFQAEELPTRSGEATSEVVLQGEKVTRPVILSGIASALDVEPSDVEIVNVCATNTDINAPPTPPTDGQCEDGATLSLGMKQKASMRMQSVYPGWVQRQPRCLKVTDVDRPLDSCTSTGRIWSAAKCIQLRSGNTQISDENSCTTSGATWNDGECLATIYATEDSCCEEQSCAARLRSWEQATCNCPESESCTEQDGTPTNQAECETYQRSDSIRAVLPADEGAAERCVELYYKNPTNQCSEPTDGCNGQDQQTPTSESCCGSDEYTFIESLSSYLKRSLKETMGMGDSSQQACISVDIEGPPSGSSGRRQLQEALTEVPGQQFAVELHLTKRLLDHADSDITEVTDNTFSERLSTTFGTIAAQQAGICSIANLLDKDSCDANADATWTAYTAPVTGDDFSVENFETSVDFSVTKTVDVESSDVATEALLSETLTQAASITAGFANENRVCADNTMWYSEDVDQEAECVGTSDGSCDDGNCDCALNADRTDCQILEGDCLYIPAHGQQSDSDNAPVRPSRRSCSDYIDFGPQEMRCGLNDESFQCLSNTGQPELCIGWAQVGDVNRNCESGNDEHLRCSSTTEGKVSVRTNDGFGCYLADCTGTDDDSDSTITGTGAECEAKGGDVGTASSLSGWTYRDAAPKVLCSADPIARRECPRTCGTCETEFAAATAVSATYAPAMVDVVTSDHDITFPLIFYASRCWSRSPQEECPDGHDCTGFTHLGVTQGQCTGTGKHWLTDSELEIAVRDDVQRSFGNSIISRQEAIERFEVSIATTDSAEMTTAVDSAEIVVVDFKIKATANARSSSVADLYQDFRDCARDYTSCSGASLYGTHNRRGQYSGATMVTRYMIWTVCNDANKCSNDPDWRSDANNVGCENILSCDETGSSGLSVEKQLASAACPERCETCAEQTYESRAPSQYQDRICEPLTQCAPTGGVVVRPHTASSDRQCGCESNYFENFEASSAFQACEPISSCAVGTYEYAPATRTSDTNCKIITQCVTNTISIPATATADQQCSCRANYYSVHHACAAVRLSGSDEDESNCRAAGSEEDSPCIYRATDTPPSCFAGYELIVESVDQRTVTTREDLPAGASAYLQGPQRNPMRVAWSGSDELDVHVEEVQGERVIVLSQTVATLITQGNTLTLTYIPRENGPMNPPRCVRQRDACQPNEYELVSPTAVTQRQCKKITTCHEGCRALGDDPEAATAATTDTPMKQCGTRCEHREHETCTSNDRELLNTYGFTHITGSVCTGDCADRDPDADGEDADDDPENDLTCQVDDATNTEYKCKCEPTVLSWGGTSAECARLDGIFRDVGYEDGDGHTIEGGMVWVRSLVLQGPTRTSEGDATDDRRCICDAGAETFASAEWQDPEAHFSPMCHPWTECNPDPTVQFEAQTPSAARDRDCQQTRVCVEDADMTETQAPTATSDRVCQCRDGFFVDDDECTEASVCTENQWMQREPTSDSD